MGPAGIPCGAAAGVLDEAPLPLTCELSLPDLSARQRTLGEFAGKVLLVNFWASWCLPCFDEMPAISRLAGLMRDQPFAVVGVNVGEAPRRVQAVARRLDLAFTILLDRDSATFRAWGASVLPTSYLLDRCGRARYVGRGPLAWDSPGIVDRILELVEQDSGAGAPCVLAPVRSSALRR